MHASLIPAGDRRCIWMDAGVLSLKICDRDLRCDECPLDRALRGEDRGTASRLADAALPAALDPLSRFALDTSLYYHPGHTWMRVEAPDRVRVGISPFLAQVLVSIDALSFQRPGKTISSDVPLGEILQGERCFPILSPLSGVVVEANRELGSCPSLALLDPFDRGWILLVAPSSLDADAARCRIGREVLTWMLRRVDWLKAYATADTGGSRARLGATLQDGGRIRAALRDLLPPERYRRLVLALLGPGDEWDLEP